MLFAWRTMGRLPTVALLIACASFVSPIFAQNSSRDVLHIEDDAKDDFLTRKGGAPKFSTPAAPVELEWGVPPIPWRATLVVANGITVPADQPRLYSRTVSLGTSASSYVWQPWFMKVNGSGTVAKTGTAYKDASADTSLYNLSVSGLLLPGTRHPLGATLAFAGANGETSGAGGGASATTTQSTNLGINQNYTPWDNTYSSTLSYAWTQSRVATQIPAGAPADVANSQSLGLSIAVPLRTQNPQSATGTFKYLTASGSARPSRSSADLGAAHQMYLEDYVMDINTAANLSQSQQDIGGARSTSSVAAISSLMSWIPSDDYPLSINGNAGYFQTSAGQNAGSSDSSALSLGLGAAYPLNKNWRTNGNASLANQRLRFGETDANLTTFAVQGALGWSGDGVGNKIRDWHYSLSYGAGAGLGYSAASNSGGEGSANIGISQGQNIHRAIKVDESSDAFVGFSQGFGISSGSQSGFSMSPLFHSFTATMAGRGNASSYSYGVHANDSRALGDGQSSQVFGANSNLARQVGAYANLTASGALKYSTQSSSGGGRSIISGFFVAGYTNQRFANTSGLSYDAKYTLTITQPEARSGNQFNKDHSISQSWSWRFGLLGWSLSHTASAAVGAPLSQSIMFTLSRDFSGVL